jgi:O-antigen/teichoic acid export membrane protein
MSRTSRVLTSAALGYVQLALATLVGLWFTPFLLRHIGRTAFGLWSVGTPVLAYVALTDFGLMTLFQREIAFALGAAQGNHRAIADLPVTLGKTLRLVVMQLPALAAAIAIALYAMPRTWDALRAPLAIILVSFLVTFPFRVNHALLMGLQDLQFLSALSIANWTLGVVVSIVLVLHGWGLYALAIAWSVAQLTSHLAYYVRVKRRFPHALPHGLPSLSRAEAAGRLARGFWIILSQLAVMLATGTDLVVIAAILGPASVVPYTITDKLVTLFANVPQHLLAAAQPGLSEVKASHERVRLAAICVALTRAVLLVSGLIASVIVAVDQGFVGWWVGSHEFAGGTVVVLLLASMVLGHWVAATVYTLFSFGYERLISITSILTGVLTLGATVVCVRHFGVAGAPLASIIGFVVVALPTTLVAIARETGVTAGALLLSVLPWAWRFVLVIGSAGTVTRLWVPRSLVAIVATSIAVALVYVVLMLPLALKEPLGTYVRPRIATLRTRLGRRV